MYVQERSREFVKDEVQAIVIREWALWGQVSSYPPTED
jgi:hypothetical protein